jgi:uncharacterized iron-regulated protein
MKKILFAIAGMLLLASFKTDKPAYLIYTAKVEDASYADMLKAASSADVVLFGEMHNNPICHWLQLELTKDLYEKKKDKLILGAEMFERDDQPVLDEYISKLIKESNFKKEAKLWPNYDTDYKPLVDFAREKGLTFAASNVPRRYAALVNASGFEALEKVAQDQRKYIAPEGFPYDPELPGYKKMLEAEPGMSSSHVSENLPKAQALKDATMAHTISQHAAGNKVFLHFNGTYHSDNFEGIVWYLAHYSPGLKVMTIASTEMADISKPGENVKGLADFIIAIPENMTKTY